jgi:hypothetical protein
LATFFGDISGDLQSALASNNGNKALLSRTLLTPHFYLTSIHDAVVYLSDGGLCLANTLQAELDYGEFLEKLSILTYRWHWQSA